MKRRCNTLSTLSALVFAFISFGVPATLLADEPIALPCANCSGEPLLVDQGFQMDVDTTDPVLQVPPSLRPYFQQIVDSATGRTRWVFDFGSRKLMLFNGAEIAITASGLLPDLEIRSACAVYVAADSGFRFAGRDGGRIALITGGELRYDGFLHSEAQQTMGAVRFNSNCGPLITGSQSEIRIQGRQALTGAIRLQTCRGDLFLAGSIDLNYTEGETAGTVTVAALDGQIDIDGATIYEQDGARITRASGIHIRSQGSAKPGRLLVEAHRDLNIYGLGFPWKNEDSVINTAESQGTLSIEKGDTHQGANLQLTSKTGNLYLHDFAVDVAGLQNGLTQVNLNADLNLVVTNNSNQPARTAIDGRGLGGDHNQGATLALQSHQEKILLMAGTNLDAAGTNEGETGTIRLTSCRGVFSQALLTPSAQEANVCGTVPPVGSYETLTLAPARLPQAVVGTAYHVALQSSHSGGLRGRFVLTQGPQGLQLDEIGGRLTWAEPLAGNHPVAVSVTAGCTSLTQTYTLEVPQAQENQAPLFVSQPVTNGQVDQSYTYQVAVRDPDHAPEQLQLIVQQGPRGLNLDPAQRLLSWTPAEDQVGAQLVTLQVVDPLGATATQHYEIQVETRPNGAPQFTSVPILAATAEYTYQYQARASDPDDDALSFAMVGGPQELTVSATGWVRWTPTREQIGDHPVTLTVEDADGASDTQSFVISVQPPPNQSPSFTSEPMVTATVGQAYAYQATASDPDGDSLTFSLENGPAGFAVAADGSTNWIPEPSQAGTQTVTLLVHDGRGGEARQPFTIQVTAPANQSPRFTSEPVLTVVAGASYTYTVTATDPDNDPLRFSLLEAPAGMTQAADGGVISWLAPADCEAGPVTVTTQVSDDRDGSDQQTFILNVERGGGSTGFTFVVDRAANGDRLVNESDETNNQVTYTTHRCTGWSAEACPHDHDAVDVVTPPARRIETQATADVVKGRPRPGFDLRVAGFDRAEEFVDHTTLTRSGTLRVHIENNGLNDIAVPFDVRLYEDQNGDGVFGPEDEPLGTQSIPSLAATSDTWLDFPLQGEALFAGNILYVDLDTTNQVAETREDNNRQHSGAYLEFRPPVGLLLPELEWKWTNEEDDGRYANVEMSPLVLNVNDDNGDGLINEYDVPDVLFVGGDCQGSSPAVLFALDGRDGRVLWSTDVSQVALRGCFNIAGGDLDGDGLVEIMALSRQATPQTFFIFEHDGTLKGQSDPFPERGPSAGISPSSLVLADLNADGTPEILFDNYIFDNQGRLLVHGPGITDRQYTSIAVDLDLDGTQEVLYGPYAIRLDGSVVWDLSDVFADPSLVFTLFPAVGNFDSDPFPEIVLHGPTSTNGGGKIAIFEHDGTLKIRGDYANDTSRGGGPPTIADFDNDGQPEIGICSRTEYAVLETDLSIKWTYPIRDNSSGYTGSTVFDFEGDGRAEVIMRDELYMFVFDGETGAVLFRVPNPSGTLTEYPVVADVDGDARAEIITTQNNFNNNGDDLGITEFGVFVYGDLLNNWANARPMWNQHAYAVANVNDDGTIPARPDTFWQHPATNIFRGQLSPGRNPVAAPDLTVSRIREDNCACPDQLRFSARIGNGGSAPAPAGIPVSIFDGVPGQGGKLLGVVQTSGVLAPGQFETIQFAANPDTCLPTPPTIVSQPALRHPQGELYRYAVEVVGREGMVPTFQLLNDRNPLHPNTPFIRFDEALGEVQILPTALPGLVPVALQVGDGRGGVDVQVWTVEIVDSGNMAPVFTSDPVTEASHNIEYRYTVTAEDPNDHPITFDLIQGDPGMVLDPLSGLLTWTPVQRNQVQEIIVEAHDGRGYRSRQFFTVRVSNLTPVFTSTVPDLVELTIGGRWEYQPTAFDPNGDAVIFSISNNENFRYEESTNTVIFEPIRLNSGSTFVFADDVGAAGRSSQTIRYRVIADPDNLPPVVTSTPPTAAYLGEAYAYQVVAEDPNGDTLHYRLGASRQGMTLSENGLFEWVPTSTGTVTVTILVDDYRGSRITHQYSLEVVERTNQAPLFTALPENAVSVVNQPYQFQLAANDPDGDALTFSLLEGPEGAAVDAAGLLTWIPSTLGAFNLTVAVADPQGAGEQAGFTLTVIDSNQSPAFVDFPTEIALFVGDVLTTQLTATDADGDSLVFAREGGPEGLTVTPSGLVTWTPAAPGRFDVAVSVNDERGGLTQGLFVIDVSERPNQAPEIVSMPPTDPVYLGTSFFYKVVAYDPDQDPVTLTLADPPQGLVLAHSGLVTWTPTDAGTFGFVVQADDGLGGVARQAVTVVVTEPPNTAAPVIVSVPKQVTRVASLYTYQILAEDADADPITHSLLEAPQGMTVDVATGLVSWTPSQAQIGDHLVTVGVDDGREGSATQTFSLRVTPEPNRAPRFTSTPSDVIAQDQVWTYQLTATDADGDVLTFQLLSGPEGMTLDGDLVRWEPTTTGTFPVRLKVTDPYKDRDEQTFTITVTDPLGNRAPAFLTKPNVAVSVDQPWFYSFEVEDLDGDAVTFALTEAPQGMALLGQTLNWTPDTMGFNHVVLQATDSQGAITEQTFTLTVQALGNRPPRFTSQPLLTAQAGVRYTYDAVVEDLDGYPISFRVTQAPGAMLLDRWRGILDWTPTMDDIGAHEITLIVADAHGIEARQRYTLQVVDPGDISAPVIALNFTQAELDLGDTFTFNVATPDRSDIAVIEARLADQPIALDANLAGSWVADVAGRVTLTVSAQDAAGNESSAEASIFVRDPADTTAPLVAIHAPDRNGTVTAPTDVVVSVLDERLSHWTLEITRAGENCWRTIAEGREPLDRATAGVFDTSLLANGMYHLRLSAVDAGDNLVGDQVTVIVDGNLKVGRFEMGFQDIAVPLRGVPVELNRTYDSTDKCPGDFGYGWRLAEPDVQVNITMGLFWELDEQRFCVPPSGRPIYPPYNICTGVELPYYCIQDSFAHYVTVTMPDGKTESWDVSLDPVGSAERICVEVTPPRGMRLVFTPRPGTTSRLEATDQNIWYYAPFDRGDGSVDYLLVDDGFEVMDPKNFRLTTINNIEFMINKDEGLRSIRDLEGNRVEYGFHGIMHSSGIGVRYERDNARRIISATDPEGNSVHYAYDERGDLVAVTDREGNTVRYRYDENHNLIEVVDPNGDIPAKLYYNDQNRLIAEEDAYGNQVRYDHDIEGRQEVVTDRNGNRQVYVYDVRGNVQQHTNALGHTTLYEHDAFDREIVTVEAAGTDQERRTERTFNEAGRLLTETDAAGRVTTYRYHDNGDIAAYDAPGGFSYNFEFDSYGRLRQISDPTGLVTQTHYDGLVKEVTKPGGAVHQERYNRFGRLIETIDADGNLTEVETNRRGDRLRETRWRTLETGEREAVQTETTYDREGRWLTRIDALGFENRREVDGMGRVLVQRDAAGRETRFLYSAAGQEVERVYPDGTRVVSTYDAEGRSLSETSRLGSVQRFGRDAAGRMISTQDALGGVTHYEYDALDRQTAVVDALGRRRQTVHDRLDRRIAEIDARGAQTTSLFDEAGNEVLRILPSGREIGYAYDLKGRRTHAYYADGTTEEWVYDNRDLLVRHIDQAGQATLFEYDVLERLTTVIDVLGGVTRYRYNEVGQKVAQTDAEGRTTRWSYDGAGRMLDRTLPGGQTELFSYDAVGNRVSRRDFNGQTIRETYDAMDRLTARHFGDGSAFRYAYNALGLMIQAEGPSGTRDYHHDPLGRLRRVDEDRGTWLEYDYNPAGERVAVTTPFGTTRYAFDDNSRLSGMTSAAGDSFTIEHTIDGFRERVTYPNGNVQTYQYDDMNRIEAMELVSSQGSVLTAFTAGFDVLGNRTQLTDHTGAVHDYRYDALSRLLEERIEAPSEGISQVMGYGYDSVGNRTRVEENGVVYTATFDVNDRLTQQEDYSGITEYTYDAAGNLTREDRPDGAVVYDYNAAGRVTRAVTADGSADYHYDTAGNLIATVLNGTRTDFLVDTNRTYPSVLAEIQTDRGPPTVTYTVGDRLLGQDREGTTRFYHHDPHHNVIALSDGVGAITDRYRYEAWGTLLSGTGDTDNVYRYTGERFDNHLGWYDLRARFMAPGLGRFTTMDHWSGRDNQPITLNKYLYGNANPVMNIDPTGYFSMVDVSAANSIRNILQDIQINTGMNIVDSAMGKSEEEIYVDFGISIGGFTGLAALPFVLRMGPKIDKIQAMRTSFRSKIGGQVFPGAYCVECSQKAATLHNFPTSPSPNPNIGIVNVIPDKPGGNHWVFITREGDVVDGAYIGNVLEHNNGKIPKGLEFIAEEGYDTFPAEAYKLLLDILLDLAEKSKGK